jgi:hypothetical protein
MAVERCTKSRDTIKDMPVIAFEIIYANIKVKL